MVDINKILLLLEEAIKAKDAVTAEIKKINNRKERKKLQNALRKALKAKDEKSQEKVLNDIRHNLFLFYPD